MTDAGLKKDLKVAKTRIAEESDRLMEKNRYIHKLQVQIPSWEFDFHLLLANNCLTLLIKLYKIFAYIFFLDFQHNLILIY